MKFIQPLTFVLTCLAACMSLSPAYALPTPESQDLLRIHNTLPKKASDALFSYSVEWRIDQGEIYRATGLSFLNSTKLKEGTPAGVVTKKLVTSLKDGMVQLDPNWRGIHVNQIADQAEFTISNKEGYSLTTITVRDYSNQAIRYDLPAHSLSAEGVQAAIDLVLAVDVEYLDKFSAQKPNTASQGEIEITFDDLAPIKVKTDGKTTRQLEEEIAQQLTTAHLSELPLYPGLVTNDTRNNKPFDGSEVQLLNIPAKSLTINITDPALGVLTKFKFRDDNYSVKVFEPRFILLLVAVLGVAAGGYFWWTKSKKTG